MGNRQPGRAWPYPRRALTASAIAAEQWQDLLAIAGVAPSSEDGREALEKLHRLIGTSSVTLDGRLLSEARPRPAEIRDPVAAEAIPGAAMLARYLANVDDDSLEALLIDGLDAVVAATGGAPSRLTREERGRALAAFSDTLRWLLPALVHAHAVADARVGDGRPAVPRRETECIAIELATIWAEHADAEPEAFHDFVGAFFGLCGLEAPSRRQYSAAVQAVGDMTAMSTEALAHVRAEHMTERQRLLADLDRWRGVRLDIRSSAEQAWNRATDLGWDAEGEAASWRELARTRRPGSQST